MHFNEAENEASIQRDCAERSSQRQATKEDRLHQQIDDLKKQLEHYQRPCRICEGSGEWILPPLSIDCSKSTIDVTEANDRIKPCKRCKGKGFEPIIRIPAVLANIMKLMVLNLSLEGADVKGDKLIIGGYIFTPDPEDKEFYLMEGPDA